LLLLLAAALTAACGEMPLAPDAATPDAALNGSAAASLGRDRRAFPCRISKATPGGRYAYWYGTASLYFPRAALAADGATVYYRVRYQRGESLPVATASCVIPRSEMAIGIADKFFGAQRGVKVQTGRKPGEITTMACEQLSNCEIDAINVVVPPKEVAPTEEDPCARGACWDRYGDGSSGGWSGYDYSGDGSGSPGGTDPTWGDPPKPCDVPDAALDSPEIQAAMQQIWDETNASAADQTQRIEHGGWIIEGANGFSYQPFASTSVLRSCGFEVNEPIPPGAIGFIHSHPWRTGEEMRTCGAYPDGTYPVYNGNASHNDIETAKGAERLRWGTGRGYIIDKNGISLFSPYTQATDRNGGGRDERYGRCGY
jgi:hypothetical protein